MQPDTVILWLRIEALEGCFIIDESNNDLPFLRSILLSNQHEIAVIDSCFDHGITICSEDEKIASAKQGDRKTNVLFNILFRKLRNTAGKLVRKEKLFEWLQAHETDVSQAQESIYTKLSAMRGKSSPF